MLPTVGERDILAHLRRRMSVATFGLSHIALAVSDTERAFQFYQSVFGMIAVYRSESLVQAQTPGTRDVLVLEKSDECRTDTGGIAHFGFRLKDASAIVHAASLIVAAGGTIVERGEFVPGEPYIFARDPDGYLIEVWFEIPTAVDPASDLG